MGKFKILLLLLFACNSPAKQEKEVMLIKVYRLDTLNHTVFGYVVDTTWYDSLIYKPIK